MRKKKNQDERWDFVLYVSDNQTSLSRQAIENLNEICEKHIKDRYSIQIIDVKDRPEIAFEKNIIATPTLIRKLPEPVKRAIGDLSESEKALVTLEIRTHPFQS